MKKGVDKTTMGHTFCCLVGGERNNTDGEQTTKKWEADKHAKR